MFDEPKSVHGDTPEDELSNGQLYERLQGAKLVAANQAAQIALLKEIAESLRDEVLRNKREMDTVTGSCLDIARQLAYHGSDDHKGKNEALLRAIARLMNLQWQYSDAAKPRDMDDIPF